MKRVRVLAVLLALTTCVAVLVGALATPALAVETGYDGDPEQLTGANWMSGIADDRQLSDLDIPGTHNSALARVYLDGQTTAQANAREYVLAQSRTIPQQLDDGVRLLDLALTTRKPTTGWTSDTDKLWAAQTMRLYGNVNACFYAQDPNGNAISFRRAINYARAFLKKHPTETIVVSLRADGGAATAVFPLLRQELDALASYLYLESDMPKLGDVRGKIVICTEHPELLGDRAGLGFPALGDFRGVGGVRFTTSNASTAASAEALKPLGEIPASSASHVGESRVVYSAPTTSSQVKPVERAAEVNAVLYGSGGRFAARGMLHGWSLSDYLDASSESANPRTLWLANFKEQHYVQVSFRTMQPGEQEIDSSRAMVGGSILVPGCDLVVPAKVFTGWNTKADGTGATYQPGQRMEVTGETTLWAQWKMTWASLEDCLDSLAAGSEVTIALEGDLAATALDTCLHVPDKAKITMQMNRHTLDRACATAVADGSVFKLGAGATLLLVGPSGTVTGGHTNGLGGGVSMGRGSTLELDGVSVTGNMADAGGGGIAVPEDATLRVKGATVVAGNEDATGQADNVFLASGAAGVSAIQVAGPFASDARIGVNTSLQPKESAIVVSAGLKGRGASTTFTSDDPVYSVGLTDAGEALLNRASKVRFESNGGTSVLDATVPYGGNVTKPGDPVRYYLARHGLDATQGKYVFLGWYADAGLTQAWDFNTDTVTRDLTLYAKWGVRVTFDMNGATSAAEPDQVLNVGEKIAKPQDPTRDGYTFKCWTYSVPLGGGRVPTPVAFDFGRPLNYSVALKAQWEKNSTTPVPPIEHTVTFHNNDGTSASKTMSVIEGTNVGVPDESPVRNDFAFVGWSTDATTNTPYDFSTPVTRSFDLYAMWEAKKQEQGKTYYTVSFDTNGGVPVPKAQQVESGGKATEPDAPALAHHTFAGWYTEETGGEAWNFSDGTITHDLVLHAHWTPLTHTVAFESNGGSNVEKQVVVDGACAVSPDPAPTRDGYRFLGWYEIVDEGSGDIEFYDFSQPVTTGHTLYALWSEEDGQASSYTVTFQYGNGAEDRKVTVDEGYPVAKPEDPTFANHVFEGWQFLLPKDIVTPEMVEELGLTDVIWFDENGDALMPYDFSWAVLGDITLRARWSDVRHTVSFDTAGGTPVETQYIVHGQTVERPTDPVREGYAFLGWSASEADGGQGLGGQALTAAADVAFYDFSKPVEADLTLRAVWDEGDPLYVVSFDANGGTEVESQQVRYLGHAHKPTTTREGHRLIGWYLPIDQEDVNMDQLEQLFAEYPELKEATRIDEERGQVLLSFDFEDPIFEDTELRAEWDPYAYAVRFHDGESTLDELGQSVSWGATATEPEEPYRFGSKFAGWYADAELTQAYDFSTPVTADLDLYAGYTLNAYTVSFDSRGGSAVEAQQVVHGGKAARPTDPSKDGHTFLGWYLLIAEHANPADFDEVPESMRERMWFDDGNAYLPFDFEGVEIQSNTTLYARWQEGEGPAPTPSPAPKSDATPRKANTLPRTDDMGVGTGTLAVFALGACVLIGAGLRRRQTK